MGTTKAKPKAANATDPSQKKPQLKALGGSQSDAWNSILANQAMQSLWLEHSNEDDRDKQIKATSGSVGQPRQRPPAGGDKLERCRWVRAGDAEIHKALP